MFACALLGIFCTSARGDDSAAAIRARLRAIPSSGKVQLTENDWRKILTPAQFAVLRQAATEPPFQNEYANTRAAGNYCCGACGIELFASTTKFDSGTGWPSFSDVIDKQRIRLAVDHSEGHTRQEVLCARCGSHLGHLFKDGPPPTRLRYCLNSAALKLKAVARSTR